MSFSLGVIGLGRMAQAILLPLLERGEFHPDEVLGVVGHKESVQSVKEHLPEGVRVFSSDDPNSVDVWEAPVQLLAIKPQQLDGLDTNMSQTKSVTSSARPLLISLLAGVTL